MSDRDGKTGEDARLVEATRGGDLCAFEQLIAKYQKSVFNVALYKSKNYFDAEDLTQDIFLAAYRAIDTLQSVDGFSSWLFGIAYNRCHKWFQRERTKVVKFEELRRRAVEAERSSHREARRAPPRPAQAPPGAGDMPLTELLGRLPDDVREALRLKYLEGLSYQEIEGNLGVNYHRVDYLIRKGKQLLRAQSSREEHA